MMSNSKQTRYGIRTKTQTSTIKFTVKKSSPGLLTGRKSRSLKQDCIVIESLPTQLKSPRKRLQEAEEAVTESNSELNSPKKRSKGTENATTESNLDVSPSKRSRSRSSKRDNEADSTPKKSRTPKKKLFADENDNAGSNTPKKKLLDDENEEDCPVDSLKQKSATTAASLRKSARIAKVLDEINSKSSKLSVEEALKSSEEPLAVELEQDEVTSTTHSTLGDEVDEVLNALNRNIPDELPGRDHLSQQLYDIIVNSFANKESKSIYISGSPGSGKTVTTKILLSRQNIKRKCNVIYVNCMKLGIKETIFTVIANKAKKRDEKIVKNATIDDVRELMSNKSKPFLLVLDEIDEINTKDPTDLYAVFRLTSTLPKGKIVLIGIGNTLNFINKHLPFLHFKNCKPITVQFPSYTEHEIINIITNRLKNVKFQRLKFPESAIELLARKVASFGGDARAAIGVACASVRDVLKNVDLDSAEGEYTVDLITVKTVVDAMYDTVERFRKEKKTVNSSCQIDTFPLQQKLILCSLLLVIKKDICPLGELTIDRIRNMYKEMCESEKYEVLIHKEFLNACKLIESYQIFSIINKSGRGKKRNVDKVMLKWDVDEMTKALSKERLFGNILSSRL